MTVEQTEFIEQERNDLFSIHEMKNTRSPIHLFIVIDLFVTSHVMKCKTRKKITC